MNQSNRSEGYAHSPGTIRLGDLEVQRIGYGAMRLPGKEGPNAGRSRGDWQARLARPSAR